MLNKGEIEEYREILYDLIADENVYDSIKKAVEGTFMYLEQLEAEKQKLIEKLEKDKDKHYKTCMGCYASILLAFVKGEKNG